ncbi:PTS transporter subunit EIIC [Aureibacillus halotolerans]|uniref:PTS system IIB component (Glc family) /PTS system IIC component (Glc family) n=1 Tax=Aureibacillus halotolerans TaxID=1508390 RepID=A0A4R6U970_9BACI|nr:PTS transporter subunit EIIC [Aureibacillus halotolerans]TDQ42981.1 PTS system IIB component (Glc family) /PTS system IIC component (Glc family) [Aureibacillus halotolerans]
MKKEQVLAREILTLVGGEENITSLNHCMTRVRLGIKDDANVDIQALKGTTGVMGVVEDTTLQIVVGPGTVNRVVDEMRKLTSLRVGEEETDFSNLAKDTKAGIKKKNSTPLKNGLRRVGNIFIPLIPALIASGIINGVANFAVNAGVDREETWISILLFFGSGIFSFLGILVGWTTAKEFGGTPALGAIAGIFIINPALENITLFGEDLTAGRGGLIAVMLAAWLMVIVERSCRKFVPVAIDIIMTPLISVLVVGMATLFVIQPVGAFLSNGIVSFINAVLDIGGPVAGAVLGGFFLPLVIVGLHHGLTPIHAQFIESTGVTPILTILAMGGAGQVGAAIAIYMKTKSERLRLTIKGGLPVGFLGIGEPLLYGVTLPLGRPFITACMGAAVGGAFQAIFNTAAHGIGVSGLSLTPLIADGKYLLYLLAIAIAYASGFLFTYLFGFKEEMAKNLE